MSHIPRRLQVPPRAFTALTALELLSEVENPAPVEDGPLVPGGGRELLACEKALRKAACECLRNYLLGEVELDSTTITPFPQENFFLDWNGEVEEEEEDEEEDEEDLLPGTITMEEEEAD